MIVTAKPVIEGEINNINNETPRYEVYKEVEMTSIADKKVTVKQLEGAYTEDEITNDIANLDNEIADLTNRKAEKQAILDKIKSL